MSVRMDLDRAAFYEVELLDMKGSQVGRAVLSRGELEGLIDDFNHMVTLRLPMTTATGMRVSLSFRLFNPQCVSEIRVSPQQDRLTSVEFYLMCVRCGRREPNVRFSYKAKANICVPRCGEEEKR